MDNRVLHDTLCDGRKLDIEPDIIGVSGWKGECMTSEEETIKRLRTIRNDMLSRCYDESAKDYKYYGAKGIRVYKPWVRSLNSFSVWALLNGYKENLTLDRKDRNKGYFPDNCQWISMAEQNRNRSQNIIVRIGEEEMCFKDWCKKLGLNYNTMYMRMKRGKSADLVISEAILESEVNL